MASGPITTSWQIEEGKVEAVTDFVFLGSKSTVDSDCSHEIKSVRLLMTPWTAAYQVPLSMGFSRQEYWSGVPLPSPRLWLTHLTFENFTKVHDHVSSLT